MVDGVPENYIGPGLADMVTANPEPRAFALVLAMYLLDIWLRASDVKSTG